MCFIIIYLFFSCSKDADLFTETVIASENETSLDYEMVNDEFVTNYSNSIVLDVLKNDTYTPLDDITIISTTLPEYGNAQINNDKATITYTPTSDLNENAVDVFTYTVEITNENTTTTQTGSIEITILTSIDTNQSPTLLFGSGFENIELQNSSSDYTYITGTDSQTGFTWPPNLLGSGTGSEPSGIHTINDDGGAAIDNKIETVTGHTGNQTSALFQRVKYDVQVTQTPYQINNIKENPNELYISYWMKTDATSLVGIDKWRAIWEYKTKNYASYQNGFRMIAFMATDYEGKPYWLFQGDSSPQNPIWQKENYEVPLILNEWFKVEYYIKWSATADGYASMKVNGQLIGEHHGATTNNADNLDFILLTQVYGNSYPMHQWVDDIEIWNGVPMNYE